MKIGLNSIAMIESLLILISSDSKYIDLNRYYINIE